MEEARAVCLRLTRETGLTTILNFTFLPGATSFLSERRYRGALGELAEHLSHDAGLHIEFKVYSAEKVGTGRGQISMFYLRSGSRSVKSSAGSENIFEGCEHHLAAGEIPPHEATRLLFNRCSGLLLAGEFLRHDPPSAEEGRFYRAESGQGAKWPLGMRC